MALSKRERGFVALLLFTVGVAVGRFALAPDRVEERVVVRDRIVTKTIEAKQTATDAERQKVVTVYRDKLVSGEVREVVRVEYRDRVVAVTAEAKASSQVAERVVEKLVAPKDPKWILGAGVGLAPFKMQPVVMIEGGYRIAGPLSLGLWATVPPRDPAGAAVGVIARLDF